MGDDEDSELKSSNQEVTPYKFKQKEGGVGKKLDNTFNKFSGNKKAIVIVVGILILVVVGGAFTGNVIKTSSELQKCQKSLTDSYESSAVLSSNIADLQGNVDNLSANLSVLTDQSLECQKNYTSCLDDVASLASAKKGLSADLIESSQRLKNTQLDLSTCDTNLDEVIRDYNKIKAENEELTSEKNTLEKAYATFLCCPSASKGYKYYTVTDGGILCCHSESDGYLCGAMGVSEVNIPSDSVVDLSC